MDKLTKFEKKFNTPRSHWTKTQWRKVALHFAGIELIETRGRKAKTPKEIYNDEQNLSAAAFWRDDARTKQSKSEDEVVFEVSERTKWDKLSKSSANKIIRNDAIKRDAQRKKKEEEEQANKKEEEEQANKKEEEEQANKKEEEEQANKKEKKPPTLSALTKAIQENQKKMREK